MNQDEAEGGQTFPAAMRRGRQALGLSQRALSQKLTELGVTIDQAGITRMESGQREPRLSEAVVIAEYLQFDVLQVDHDLPNVSYYGAMQKATQRYFDARTAVADYLHAAKYAATQYKLWELGDPSSDDDGEFLAHTATLPGSEKTYDAKPVDFNDLDWDWSVPYLTNLLRGLSPESDLAKNLGDSSGAV
ncbi:helix-turn-helix transcriptional regulator [Nocardia sp. 348MFTsu5.1]|uniref:helix-turn-helix domain-containing protein n=1 Tax=Nocardia sp. 348MFTsu5.1 TaxID=1172185 RepID=UPI00048F8430|nr:helix-turn-helix transcriptional regulator [Nocardia sp. 348MFTsu5.1]